MTLRRVAARLPRSLWQRLTRKSVWLHADGSVTLRGFSARAAIRWHRQNLK